MSSLIYVADDEQDILDVMQEFLLNAGYDVQTFLTGDALFSAFQEKPCDLVVLDIMMLGTDGLSICKKLREVSDVPIIILTAREAESDHIRGFMLGRDDYIIKPFSSSLLIVRIKALLRCVKMDAPDKGEKKEYGDISFSGKDHTAVCKGKSLGLTMTEFSFLGCLIEQPKTAVSRKDLLDWIWGDAEDVETRVTDETVRRIRQKIKAAGSCVKISAV